MNVDLVEQSATPMLRRHPWETARFAFFRDVLWRAGALRAGARILDVGAGDGWFASRIADERDDHAVVAWDVGYAEGFPSCGSARLQYTARRPEGAFDLVLMLDVVEHVDDDAGFVEQTVRTNMAAGGSLLLSVPAWPWLFGAHDVRLGHRRRYTPGVARRMLEGAGLEVRLAGGLFHSLLALRATANLVLHDIGCPPESADEWRGSPTTTLVIDALLRAEARGSSWLARRGLELPGLSWWALCRLRGS